MSVGVVAHAFSPRILEEEAGGSLYSLDYVVGSKTVKAEP